MVLILVRWNFVIDWFLIWTECRRTYIPDWLWNSRAVYEFCSLNGPDWDSHHYQKKIWMSGPLVSFWQVLNQCSSKWCFIKSMKNPCFWFFKLCDKIYSRKMCMQTNPGGQMKPPSANNGVFQKWTPRKAFAWRRMKIRCMDSLSSSRWPFHQGDLFCMWRSLPLLPVT